MVVDRSAAKSMRKGRGFAGKAHVIAELINVNKLNLLNSSSQLSGLSVAGCELDGLRLEHSVESSLTQSYPSSKVDKRNQNALTLCGHVGA